MTLRVSTNLLSDIDAISYLSRVMEADGQPLEYAVQLAVNNFVVGCKADGIWNAIKASCILAGARTLAGALVPLVGPAPTNFNFVSADYNRKTGLVGDASTKYLDTNRSDGADPQNNFHQSLYVSSPTVNDGVYMGTVNFTTNQGSHMQSDRVNNRFIFRNRLANPFAIRANASATTGFVGQSRDSSSSFISRIGQSSVTELLTSVTPQGINHLVFGRNNGAITPPSGSGTYSSVRLSFYSIGESLNLALLDARIATLISALQTAIP